jgi:hypothetical protein
MLTRSIHPGAESFLLFHSISRELAVLLGEMNERQSNAMSIV